MKARSMDAAVFKAMSDHPKAFRDHTMIRTDEGLVRFADCMDPWQRRDLDATDEAWRRVVGHKVGDDVPNRFYLERPRGHSKTTDVSRQMAWPILFSRRQVHGFAASGDKDQARLIRDALDRFATDNPWSRDVLDVQQNRVVNTRTGSTLTILAADSHTSYGILPDYLVIDELTNWKDAGEHLWIALYSAVAKRSHCLLLVISNAGMGQGVSWQWKIREAFRTDPGCHFSRLDGPVASWISEKQLAEQRRLLPTLAYDRLWLNRWTTGSGDAIPVEDIDASLTLDGPLAGRQHGWVYIGGLDLGLTRDATALVLIGKHVPTGRLRVVYVQSWKPRPGTRVSIELIEKAILDVHRRFRLALLAYDPWQSQYLADRLSKQGVTTREVNFQPSNLQAMATATIEAFSERTVELFRHEELVRDLQSLRVVEKSYGWRLDPQRNSDGHGDRAVALSLALMSAKDITRDPNVSWGGVIWV